MYVSLRLASMVVLAAVYLLMGIHLLVNVLKVLQVRSSGFVVIVFLFLFFYIFSICKLSQRVIFSLCKKIIKSNVSTSCKPHFAVTSVVTSHESNTCSVFASQACLHC